MRLNTDGSLDTSFDGDGRVITAVAAGLGDDRANSVEIVGSGASRKILIGGRTRPPSNPGLQPGTPLLARYNSNGTLDNSFGTGGISVFDVPGNACPEGYGCGDEIRDIALQPDGKIVATGSWVSWGAFPGGVGSSSKTNMLTARFSATGAIDTPFDSDGYVITTYAPGFYTDIGNSIAVQADGRIVSFGWTDESGPPPAISPADHDFLFVRFNTNGSYDTSFDGDGIRLVEVSDGNSFDDGDAMLLDGSGRAVGVGLRTLQNGNSYIGAARLTTGGALDTTFGPDGPDAGTTPDGYFVTQLIGGSRDEAGAVAVQPDGKTVVAGWTDTGSNNFDFGLARFNVDGTPDTTFNGDGRASGGNGTQVDTGRAVAIQSDGKIVVAGDSYGTGTPTLTIMRFTAAGVLDTTWSDDGVATGSWGTNSNQAQAVAIDSSGRIVVAGTTSNSAGNWNFLVARFTSNGVLDTTFNGTGVNISGPAGYDEFRAVALQPDGKIVAGGKSTSGQAELFAVARYNANGTLDTSFDGDGVVTTRLSTPNNDPFGRDEIRGLALLPDGRIVAGGKALNNATPSSLNAFAVARYNPDGSLDTSLAGDGTLLFNLQSDNLDEIHGIALQFDEKIVAFGTSFSLSSGAGDLAVARFNWDDGSLDTTYATNGFITTNVEGYDRASGGVVLPGGKAVLGATTGANDFAAARYLADPAPTMPGTPDLSAASDRGRSQTDNITNDNTPTLNGSCVVGETAVLLSGGAETSPRSRARCSTSTYAATLGAILPDGTHVLSARSINGAGTSATSSTLSIVVDTVAAAPTIAAPAQNSTVLPEPTISGAGAESNADVTVRAGATVVCSTVANASGAWSCASALGPGSHTVSATQTDIAGNTSAASTARTFTVQAPTTTTLSPIGSTVFGQAADFVVQVASNYGTPDGTVQFSVDGATVSVALVNGQATLSRSDLAVGSHQIAAAYSGAAYYQPSTATTLSHVVNKANTSSSVSSSSNPSVYGQPVTLSAQISAAAPGAGIPAGTATFSIGGSVAGTATLDSAGRASLTTSTLPVGTSSITVSYGGNTNYNASSSTGLSQVVNQAAVTLGVADTPDPTVAGQSYTVSFTVQPTAPGSGSPTGTVTVGDGTDSCSAAVSAGMCTLTSTTAGSKTLSASYSGDTNFSAGSAGTPHTVARGATTTSITAHTPDPTTVGTPMTVRFSVVAVSPSSGTPSGTVTVSGGSGVQCSALVADGSCTLTFGSTGTYQLTASYAGDPNFNGSTSAAEPHEVSLQPTSTPTPSLTPTQPVPTATPSVTPISAPLPGQPSEPSATPTGTPGPSPTPTATSRVPSGPSKLLIPMISSGRGTAAPAPSPTPGRRDREPAPTPHPTGIPNPRPTPVVPLPGAR